MNFLALLIDKESKELAIDLDDEIVKGTLVTRDGAVVHPALAPAAEEKTSKPKAKAGDTKEEGGDAGAESASQEGKSDGE